MPNISSLNTPLSAMRAQRQILDVTARNIANATTPGYHRQRVELATPGTSGVSGSGGNAGVDVSRVSRSADDVIVARATREEAGRSAADATAATLARIESLFPEPTNHGLAAQLDDYWGSWSSVANDPGNQTARSSLLSKASTLVNTLRRGVEDLTAVSDGAKTRMSGIANEVNDLTARIVTFNQTITGQSDPSGDLLDQRDTLVAKVTKLTGALTQVTGTGEVNVFIGGRQVVAGAFAAQLQAPSGTLQFDDGQAVVMTSGEGASVAATINDVVPRYLSALDDIANTLVTSVNTMHAAGYGQDGVTGRNFFDPVGITAATIAISTDVAGQPSRLAAGAPKLPGPTAPGALDGNQARLIAALASSATGASTKYQTMISGMAIESRSAQQRAEVQGTIADTAVKEADSVGSVSIDEEMTQMMEAQRAFQAASRVLSTVDEMLSFLIERTGR
ncbi:MAG: flagellar hook-associated protein FlgK [Actinomycetota bacterium]